MYIYNIYVIFAMLEDFIICFLSIISNKIKVENFLYEAVEFFFIMLLMFGSTFYRLLLLNHSWIFESFSDATADATSAHKIAIFK